LFPGEAAEAPAAFLAAVAFWVGVAFEAFEDVVGLDAEFGGTLGGGDGADAASA